MPRAVVITVSDGVAAGTRQDDSGTALERWLGAHGFGVDRALVVNVPGSPRAAL